MDKMEKIRGTPNKKSKSVSGKCNKGCDEG